VNGLMYNGGYTRRNMFGLKLDYAGFLPDLVCALLAGHSGELWLIPHTLERAGHVESDNEACSKLRDRLPRGLVSRVRLVTGNYDAHELKWLIGSCDFFIGSRMHACIAALSQGVPCVGVAYSRKFAGVFESVRMEEWVVDARSCSENESVARIVSLYRQREKTRRELCRQASRVRGDLTEIFRQLVSRSARCRKTLPSPEESAALSATS